MSVEHDTIGEMPPSTAPARSGKVMVVAFMTCAVGVALYFALGMPGMDHGSDTTMGDMDMGSADAAPRLVGPATFAARLEEPDVVVINVHIPYDGEIDRTDLFMPFDTIDAAALPADRGTPLAVYCRSGNMSALAVAELVRLGFTDIVELDGGMQAWEASGRPIIRSSTSAD